MEQGTQLPEAFAAGKLTLTLLLPAGRVAPEADRLTLAGQADAAAWIEAMGLRQ
jgi:hypothetical protein